jgi:hypothetical protein
MNVEMRQQSIKATRYERERTNDKSSNRTGRKISEQANLVQCTKTLVRKEPMKMNAKRLTLLILITTLGLAAMLSGCSPAPEPVAASPSDMMPEQVARSFYDWYIAYPGNPLVDKAYRSNEYLTGEFVQKVDGIIASFDKGGYDPFLCAQDVPESFALGETSVSGDRAIVPVQTSFEGHAFTVVILRVGGEWKIADVNCGGSGTSSKVTVNVTATPEQVVQAFYDWYLGYIGDRASGEVHNPLVAEAYRSSEHLAPSLIQRVDEILLDSSQKGGYDPFLCAQDIPGGFTVGDVVIVSGERATVLLHEMWNPGTDYETVHDVEVALVLMDGQWKITGVDCLVEDSSNPMPEGPIPTTPEGAASGFYDWYLWYAREVGNPLVDGVYRSSEYLTPDLIQKVDEILASFDRGGYDPFLCAQDIPDSIILQETDLSGDRASLVVETSFEGHFFTLELREKDGRWAISDVICQQRLVSEGQPTAAPLEQEPATEARFADWQAFQDDEYGFLVQYPPDWVVQETHIGDPAGDVPIKRVLGFSPQDWQGRLTPVSVEVGVSDLEEMGMWPVSDADRASAETINGVTVLVGEGLYGEVFTVFEHPTDHELRVAVRDQTGGEDGLRGIVDGMLSSFRFTE